MCYSGHRILMNQLFVLRIPGAPNAREKHAKFDHVSRFPTPYFFFQLLIEITRKRTSSEN